MQNYFRMLRWFLPHNKVNQPYVCICPLPPEPPSHSLPQKANFNHDTRDDHLYTLVCVCVHLSGGSDGLESACTAGNPGPIPGLGRHPGEGNYETVQYSCLENFMDRGAWGGIFHGVTQSWR